MVDTSIIPEMQKKIDALKRPKGFSIRPVLIHVNGVSDSVLEQDYFAHVVNFRDFL